MAFESFDKSIYDRIAVAEDALIAEEEQSFEFGGKENWEKFKKKFKPIIPIIIMWLFWFLFIILIITSIVKVASAIYTLNLSGLNLNAFFKGFCIIGPAILWVVQSYTDHFGVVLWRKNFTLAVAVLSFCMFCVELSLVISYYIVVPLVFKIPISRDITVSMVVNLARGILTVCTLLLPFIISFTLFKTVFSRNSKDFIKDFKITKYVDLRRNKRFKYDSKYVKDIKTGRYHVIKEADRYLHTLWDGTTGTAKTSGSMSPSIVGDLNQRVYNEDYIKAQFLKLLRSKDIEITKPFTDFSAEYFAPVTERGKREMKKARDKARVAGITLLAPNSGLGDTIYEMAHKRGIKVNRIDPTLDEHEHHKPGFIGFNPLYIDPNIQGLKRRIEINARACLFADVMQAVYDSGSKGDPFFSSVNRNVTTSVTILLLLTFEGFYGRQPNPSDVQDVLNDFERARKYYDAFRKMENSEDYKFILDFVGFNMLGEGRKKMEEHASGLKMLINELLINPLFKAILCAKESIDIDRALENGEVTIVNYATELGMTQAMAFGMFFAFTFNNSVVRRPGNENTRVPHFYYIDEFAMLLHPKFEQMFTYYRQFRVASGVCIQSIDQVRKNPATAYFESVLLGNTGHQMFYGRMSHVEMDIIEKLGGTMEEIVEQKTVNETALSLENTSLSYSTRETPQTVSRVNSTIARYQDFMHVYFFTVDSGTPLPPFVGKVNFVEKHEKVGLKRYKCDWSKYFPNNTETSVNKPSNEVRTEHVVISDEVPKAEAVENDRVVEPPIINAKPTANIIIGNMMGEEKEETAHSEGVEPVYDGSFNLFDGIEEDSGVKVYNSANSFNETVNELSSEDSKSVSDNPIDEPAKNQSNDGSNSGNSDGPTIFDINSSDEDDEVDAYNNFNL